MMSINRTAQRLCRELNYCLDINSLTARLQAEGWQIRDYNDELFGVLHCSDIAQTCNAFTYYESTAEFKLVFINHQLLSQEALRLALLHELCHIALGHHLQHTGCDNNDLAEHAAEELAVNIRRIVAARPKQRIALAISIILLLALAALLCRAWQIQEKAASSVYITASGSRYHKINCYHIEDCEVISVSVDEALAMGRTPCKDCIPDG